MYTNPLFICHCSLSFQSVIKTGRLIVTHEAPQTMGFAAEIAAAVQVVYIMKTLPCNTPQPLYDTIAGIQTNFCVSYPIRVVTRVNI